MSLIEKYKHELGYLNQSYLLMMHYPDVNEFMPLETFLKTMLERSYRPQGLEHLKAALQEITTTANPQERLEVFEQATQGLLYAGAFTEDQAQYWLDSLKAECMQASLKP
jgi:hypothetical protein